MAVGCGSVWNLKSACLFADLNEGEWKVTSVVKGYQLGEPAERLRERMDRLWLKPTHTPYTRAGEGIASLEETLRSAEQRVRESEDEAWRLQAAISNANSRAQDAENRASAEVRAMQRRADDAETRAQQMEQRATQAEQRATQAEQTATQAEQTATQAEQRATQAEQRANQAEQTAAQAEQRATQAEQRANQVEQRATQAEQRANQAEQRAYQAEQRANQAEQTANQAEETAAQVEQRATRVEQTATQAEERVRVLQQQITDAEIQARRFEDEAQRQIRDVAGRLADTEERLRQAEEITATAERRNRALLAERRPQVQLQFWVVQREEIELTAEELGRGGWAVVKVAKFRGLLVAAKCLHNLIISDYNRDLFTREMNIAATVRHPNLIQFMGATVERALEPIILTELMTISLRDVLEQRPLNPPQITSISLDIARALNYLHLIRPDPIIHRDISSANVLLDPAPNDTWRAKVSDYGSANFLQRVATIGPGNPAYAAPEAIDPSRQSPKMDVYSYGVLLLEICSQRFPDMTDSDALFQLVQQPTMVGLIRQCLEHDPNRRPTMSAMIEQFEEQ